MSLATILTDEAPSSVSNTLTKPAVTEQRTRDKGRARPKQSEAGSPETRDTACSGWWYLFDHRLGDVGPEEHEVRVVAVRLRRDTVSSEIESSMQFQRRAQGHHFFKNSDLYAISATCAGTPFLQKPRTPCESSGVSHTVARAPTAPRSVSLRVMQLAL